MHVCVAFLGESLDQLVALSKEEQVVVLLSCLSSLPTILLVLLHHCAFLLERVQIARDLMTHIGIDAMSEDFGIPP